MSDLLCCPFCGGEADYRSYKTAYGGERHNVECVSCGAESGYGDATGGLSWTTEAVAKSAWNNRALDRAAVEKWCKENGYQLAGAIKVKSGFGGPPIREL